MSEADRTHLEIILFYDGGHYKLIRIFDIFVLFNYYLLSTYLFYQPLF